MFHDTAGNTPARASQGSGIDRAYAYYNDSSTVNNWAVYNDQCGDWHTVDGRVMFFPDAVHNQAWFKTGVLLGTIAGWTRRERGHDSHHDDRSEPRRRS